MTSSEDVISALLDEIEKEYYQQKKEALEAIREIRQK